MPPTDGTFDCVHCGLTVGTLDPTGAVRQHCPGCLHARHLTDHAHGGRSDCGGRMTPLAVAVPRAGEWRIIHRCVRCDELASHPVGPDDNRLVLMRTAVQPLARPPFPLEALAGL
ncbi:RNHCP domain-containing protein [Streptomyces sp. JNUCC 64]